MARSWSKEDEQLLIQMAPEKTAIELGNIFNRSKGCIVVKCRILGAKYKREGFFTTSEIEFIKNNYYTMEFDKMCKILKRSTSGTRTIIRKLGLKNKTTKVQIGDRRGKLVVVAEALRNNRRRKIEVLCDCGLKRIVDSSYFYNNMTSCGCDLPGNNEKEAGEASWCKFFNDYIKSAKGRNYIFTLSLDDFKELTSKDCFYCGASPREYNTYLKKNGQIKYINCSTRRIERSTIKINGIDRRNNKDGYVYNNCVPCCEKCNRFKLYYTEEDFLKHVERISSFQNKSKND